MEIFDKGRSMTPGPVDLGDGTVIAGPVLLDYQQLAVWLNDSIRHLRRLVSEERIPHIKVGHFVRQGELFALRRRDLDLERGMVKIGRKRLRLESGEVIEGDPKSAAGRRVVSPGGYNQGGGTPPGHVLRPR